MMKNKITYFLLLCGLLAVTATSCKDDLLYVDDGSIPEGEVMVTAQIDFRPLAEGLAAKSRTVGDTIKSINDLCVLLYDTEGNLVEARSLTKIESKDIYENQFYVNIDKRGNDDASNGHTAESKTPSAHLKLTIPYGRYYVYAVANMGKDFKDAVTAYKEEDNTLSESGKVYWNAIQDKESLKAITLTWNEEKVAQNNQMFGHFTLEGETAKDAQLLTINKKGMKLHSWIRRAASKVTVAYDGTGLEEGVFIYLKSVTIKDIPQTCLLGANNPAHPDGYQPTEGDQGVELKNLMDGETIKYYEGETEPSASDFKETYAARITKGTPLFGSGDKDKKAFHPKELSEVHTETTNALYFYENMQGKGEAGTASDKRQVVAGAEDKTKPTYPDGGVEGKEGWKDAKPYGTYIEVDAYYVSINKERVGRGPIKYRFMLGKDVITDYNAERNYHYKLTLKFKGYANDADWHIEYEEPKPSIEVPNPYYISYLYNRTMNLPVKINTGGGTLKSLKAEIVFNNWAPYGTLPLNAGGLNYARDYDYAQNPNNENLNQPWHGFLSLRKTTHTILKGPLDQVPDGEEVTKINSNQDYYETKQKGTRPYDVENIPEVEGQTVTIEDNDNGNYSFTNNGDHLLASIPLYTRAKQMYIKSAYTGNNPYVAYQRHAQVEITAEIELNKEIYNKQEIVDIYQVRRLVNPKGVYRSGGNNKAFHVVLLRLPRENYTEFVSFPSEGPWKAYVVSSATDKDFKASNNFIQLQVSNPTTTKKGTDGAIYGVTGSDIEFDITNFNGSENENKNAVIRVEYHNYTCQHLIFVHQGNKPQELLTDGAKWHVGNLISASQEATNPLDEGSLFRYKNLTQAIAAKNQYNSEIPMINVSPSKFPDPVSKNNEYELVKGNGTKVKWGDITNKPASSTDSWGLTLDSKIRIAKVEDYKALFDSDIIEQGYGVLYGDDSDKPATNIVDAYGYQEGNKYGEPQTEAIKNRGIRGCFVYNKENGNNIFFPVGASGYGHRKSKEGNGYLRYSCGQTGFFSVGAGDAFYGNDAIAQAPLFYDLYMRPGAIYWTGNTEGTGLWSRVVGWDINYFTFDFNRIYQANVFNDDKSDACFIRCVED